MQVAPVARTPAVLLNTENARLKKLVSGLQAQMLGKPTARGESAALKSMRDMVRRFAPCGSARVGRSRTQHSAA
jgi:hypothetical protein